MNKKIFALTLMGALSINNVNNAYAISNNNIQNIKEVDGVRAIKKSNIRSLNNTDSNIIGVIEEGNTLESLMKLSNGWYKVLFNDDIGYVRSDLVEEVKMEKIVGNNNMVYFNEEKRVITDFDTYEVYPQYEMAKVLYKNDEYSIINIDGIIGYTSNEGLVKLPNNFVVVDISDQEVNFYEGDESVFTSPCVTGLPTKSRETRLGYYSVFDKSYNRDLVAEDNSYRSYVDVMMKFNKGQGLHDAEYHKDYDEDNKLKKSHGWRSLSEFGGETYLHNGSHGCVNMPHDKAMELSEKVNVGTKVLVKK